MKRVISIFCGLFLLVGIAYAQRGGPSFNPPPTPCLAGFGVYYACTNQFSLFAVAPQIDSTAGSFKVGSPTGADTGNGSVDAAGDVYVNGVSVRQVQTLGCFAPAGSTTVAFANIPAASGTLVIEGSMRSTEAALSDKLMLSLNSDAGANYDEQIATVSNASQTVNAVANSVPSAQLTQLPAASSTIGYPGTFKWEIPSYAEALEKIARVENSYETAASTTTQFDLSGHLQWHSTAIISRADVAIASGTLASGSTICGYIRP